MDGRSEEIKRMLRSGHSQEEILDLFVRRYELQGHSVNHHKIIIEHIALMEEDHWLDQLFNQ